MRRLATLACIIAALLGPWCSAGDASTARARAFALWTWRIGSASTGFVE